MVTYLPHSFVNQSIITSTPSVCASQQPSQPAQPLCHSCPPLSVTLANLQDVLFGRGGLTNRHKGNLRYRDCISLHREDYTRSSKSEKPSVARRIVQAIRSGKTPGRFLKRGHDGKWIEVCDKEAAWKASQALREKTRWSCMKEAEGFHFDDDSIDARRLRKKKTRGCQIPRRNASLRKSQRAACQVAKRKRSRLRRKRFHHYLLTRRCK